MEISYATAMRRVTRRRRKGACGRGRIACAAADDQYHHPNVADRGIFGHFTNNGDIQDPALYDRSILSYSLASDDGALAGNRCNRSIRNINNRGRNVVLHDNTTQHMAALFSRLTLQQRNSPVKRFQKVPHNPSAPLADVQTRRKSTADGSETELTLRTTPLERQRFAESPTLTLRSPTSARPGSTHYSTQSTPVPVSASTTNDNGRLETINTEPPNQRATSTGVASRQNTRNDKLFGVAVGGESAVVTYTTAQQPLQSVGGGQISTSTSMQTVDEGGNYSVRSTPKGLEVGQSGMEVTHGPVGPSALNDSTIRSARPPPVQSDNSNKLQQRLRIPRTRRIRSHTSLEMSVRNLLTNEIAGTEFYSKVARATYDFRVWLTTQNVHARVELFGSSASGLADRSSDIDVSISDYTVTANYRTFGTRSAQIYPAALLQYIYERMQKCPFLTPPEDSTPKAAPTADPPQTAPIFKHLKDITTALVPIIKVLHLPTGASLDISAQTPYSCATSRLLRHLTTYDPRLRDVIVLIKVWAKRRGICNVQQKFPSAYAYALCAVNFFQTLDLLPPLALDGVFNLHDGKDSVVPSHWRNYLLGFDPLRTAGSTTQQNFSSSGGCIQNRTVECPNYRNFAASKWFANHNAANAHNPSLMATTQRLGHLPRDPPTNCIDEANDHSFDFSVLFSTNEEANVNLEESSLTYDEAQRKMIATRAADSVLVALSVVDGIPLLAGSHRVCLSHPPTYIESQDPAASDIDDESIYKVRRRSDCGSLPGASRTLVINCNAVRLKATWLPTKLRQAAQRMTSASLFRLFFKFLKEHVDRTLDVTSAFTTDSNGILFDVRNPVVGTRACKPLDQGHFDVLMRELSRAIRQSTLRDVTFDMLCDSDDPSSLRIYEGGMLPAVLSYGHHLPHTSHAALFGETSQTVERLRSKSSNILPPSEHHLNYYSAPHRSVSVEVLPLDEDCEEKMTFHECSHKKTQFTALGLSTSKSIIIPNRRAGLISKKGPCACYKHRYSVDDVEISDTSTMAPSPNNSQWSYSRAQ